MHWDAVVVSTRDETRISDVLQELSLYRSLCLLSTDRVIVVEDACDDAGSAGSTLNALLVATERLCVLKGYRVLNESVLAESSILILLVGDTDNDDVLPSALRPMTDPSSWSEKPDTVLARTIRNVNQLAESTSNGVWISGTDSTFDLPTALNEPLSTSNLSVFSFRGTWELSKTHGVYNFSSEGDLQSVTYRPCLSESSPCSIVLALLYMPAMVATQYLSLHSLNPISACTYYGEDTGNVGLRLSLFFDLVQSTCLDELSYVVNREGLEKTDHHEELRITARRVLWKVMRGLATDVVHLDINDYEYLNTDSKNHGTMVDIHGHWIASLHSEVCKRVAAHPKPIQPLIETIIAISELHQGRLYGASGLLQLLKDLCQSSPMYVRSRCLAMSSDVLALLAGSQGGLRSGPAANSRFRKILDKIKESPKYGIECLYEEAMSHWMSSPSLQIRAARHFEAAAQIVSGDAVEKMCSKYLPDIDSLTLSPLKCNVTVRSAARVDLFGGWLDTPPITLVAEPSAVVNMAVLVDGKLPLRCTIRWNTGEPGLRISGDGGSSLFTTSQQILERHCQPHHFGALVCACLVATGIANSTCDDLSIRFQKFFGCQGIELECASDLPHGSGLGTSSILSACVVLAILRSVGLAEKDISEVAIVHIVLHVEQLLTTGGGWQDQVGGIYRGIKTGFIAREAGNLRVDVRPIPVSREFEAELNRRLLLVYTGKTRLAKNLLQEVIRSWHAGGEVVVPLDQMQKAIKPCEESIARDDFPIELVQLYYDCKKKLATGCEPDSVKDFIGRMKSAGVCDVAWLAGAGGGGFLYVWMSVGAVADDIQPLLDPGMSIHTSTLTHQPVQVELG